MPVDVRIAGDGADKLEVLSRRLKAAGDSELRRELYRGLNRATKPLKEAAKRAARQDLPRRGGLNELVASARFSTRTRGGGRTPGVSLTASKAGTDLRWIDRGKLRHPVFGRSTWVNQTVPAGWFTKTLEAEGPAVRKELVTVLDDIARRLGRG